ncbi:flagellar biosynthetic protein FliO [Teredinibacter turnerae]|uniref:flagellar biosynthetic protein FliO n=1 Tax=Teredinibacter turnerae TaxID=2426 RepID=UPI00036AF903|nr:flagellar biosynthetic protein FliO [Teredinibacter turnerae]
MKNLLLMLCLLWMPLAIAQAGDVTNGGEQAATQEKADKITLVKPAARIAPSAAGVVGQVLGGLLAVIALIMVMAWLAKRMGYGGIASQGQLKIVASIPLGTREKAVIVDACGKTLLLGVAPGRVSFLHELDMQSPESVLETAQRPVSKGQDFSAYLKTIIGSGKNSA